MPSMHRGTANKLIDDNAPVSNGALLASWVYVKVDDMHHSVQLGEVSSIARLVQRSCEDVVPANAKPDLRPARLSNNHIQYLHDLGLFLQRTRIGHTPMVLK
jgi:hypothetical protein